MNFSFRDFLRFDKMLTPLFITVLYYILVVGVVLASLFMIYNGATSRYVGGQVVFIGFIGLVIGPFFVRLLCESLIILFKIHDRLKSIDDKTKPGA